MIEAVVNLTDVTGQTRGVAARVDDDFDQEDLVALTAAVAAVSNAGVHSAARLDTGIETGDTGAEGLHRSVSERIRLVYDGLGNPPVEYDLLAPVDDCFDAFGEVDVEAEPLATAIATLGLTLRTASGGVVGPLLSATFEDATPSDELVAAAARLPSGEVADSNWWPEHGSDLIARSEVP